MTNNDLAVELLQQRRKKREESQSAGAQTTTQSMSGQAALAQELLSQRIQARKEREATQPTVSLPSQRIDPAKERQESKGKFYRRGGVVEVFWEPRQNTPDRCRKPRGYRSDGRGRRDLCRGHDLSGGEHQGERAF